jgi:murine toxin
MDDMSQDALKLAINVTGEHATPDTTRFDTTKIGADTWFSPSYIEGEQGVTLNERMDAYLIDQTTGEILENFFWWPTKNEFLPASRWPKELALSIWYVNTHKRLQVGEPTAPGDDYPFRIPGVGKGNARWSVNSVSERNRFWYQGEGNRAFITHPHTNNWVKYLELAEVTLPADAEIEIKVCDRSTATVYKTVCFTPKPDRLTAVEWCKDLCDLINSDSQCTMIKAGAWDANKRISPANKGNVIWIPRNADLSLVVASSGTVASTVVDTPAALAKRSIMSTFTIYFCGTGSTKFDDSNPIYWQGELVSRLAANSRGREFADWVIIDGPGSGDLQFDELWAKPVSHGLYGTLWGSGWEENVKHAINIIKGTFDWQREKLTEENYNKLKAAEIPIEDVKVSSSWFSRTYDYGDRAVTQQQLQAQIVKMFRKGGILPASVNLVGWSRGGISCHMLANAMFDDEDLKGISVNILTIDPVPGMSNFQDHKTTLKSNVKEYVGFYARDERSKGFSCVIPKTDTSTAIHVYPLPGKHATLVGNAGRDGVSGGVVLREPGLIVRHYAEACLTTWGSNLDKKLNLTGGQILECITNIEKAVTDYESMHKEVYSSLLGAEDKGGERYVSFGAEGERFSSIQGRPFSPASGLSSNWFEMLSSMYPFDSVTRYWRGTLQANVEIVLFSGMRAQAGDKVSVIAKGAMTLDKASQSFGQEGDASRNPKGPLLFSGAPAGSLIMGIGSKDRRASEKERVVLEPLYDFIAPEEGDVYFYINERSGFYGDNVGEFMITLAITASGNMSPHMSMLDALQERLEGCFNEISEKNYIKIFDTPKIWGQPFGPDAMTCAIEREGEFESAIVSSVQKMRYRCDISSLNAPDAEWRAIILSAIDSALTAKLNRKDTPQIRFLFAQTPTALLAGLPSYFEGHPNYLALKADLIDLIQKRSPDWECVPEIWIGRFYRIVDGLQASLEKKLLPDDMVSDADTRMTWNHTKIIAVDGSESFVGGHNLNMDLFKSYPPVHDVSVKVLGGAALSSQLFLNSMWEVGADLLTREFFDASKSCWVSADDTLGKPEDPLKAAHVAKYVQDRQKELVGMAPTDPEYRKAGRILSVGKYWTGPDIRTDYKKGSEIMKEFIIKNAKKKIRMSQQDLISAWKSQWRDHDVCRWLIEALLANPELEVQIVVSPLDAAAGAGGDQYSFGSGAKRTFQLLKYYLTHDEYTDEKLEDPYGIRKSALKRIEVAPFFFTDVPRELSAEGNTYQWPDQGEAAYTATLREPPLSEVPPQAGIIGRPLISLIKGSGLVYPKVPSAPGNHAKVTIIDDELYVVGSDNLYPGYLSEFNYIIEGQDAVNALVKSYWEPLWTYSKKYSFYYGNA